MAKAAAPEKAAAPRRRRGLRIALGVVVGVAAALGVAYLALDEPRPHGNQIGQAETMATSILASVHADAWEVTSAVRFTFRGTNDHLWDRQRDYERYRHGDVEVLMNLTTHTGVAREHGERVHGDRERALFTEAFRAWTNDTFWLNPIPKFSDHGASRAVVLGDDGVRRLLVSYGNVGLTPGDAYLWTPGQGGGPPAECRMWVSVFPIGGVRTTWERWATLRTGAQVSTLHHIGPFTLELTHVDGRGTLRELVGDTDPFQLLVDEGQHEQARIQAAHDATGTGTGSHGPMGDTMHIGPGGAVRPGPDGPRPVGPLRAPEGSPRDVPERPAPSP